MTTMVSTNICAIVSNYNCAEQTHFESILSFFLKPHTLLSAKDCKSLIFHVYRFTNTKSVELELFVIEVTECRVVFVLFSVVLNSDNRGFKVQ